MKSEKVESSSLAVVSSPEPTTLGPGQAKVMWQGGGGGWGAVDLSPGRWLHTHPC